MHSLSNELLNVKVIHLGNEAIMYRKREKLIKLSRTELVQVAEEVRVELNQPWITDVLASEVVTKSELVQDIMYTITNSVKSNFKTILR